MPEKNPSISYFSVLLYDFVHTFFSLIVYLSICQYFFLLCMYLYLYLYTCLHIWILIAIQRSPENGKGEIFLFLAFDIDLLLQRWAPDFGAKTKPWVTVAYRTDTTCQEFRAVTWSCMVTVRALILLVSPASFLGWSYGYVSWKVLPRMCSKALLGVRKSVPGRLWWAMPKASCSQALAHTSFLSPSRLTFCQH